MTRQRKVVLLVCDGLGRDWLSAEHTPNLMLLREESAALEQHAAVFPSVTRVSAASIATGCLPGNHGLHGNQMALSSGAGLSVHNAGLPGFRDLMRAATGKTLNVPTMAEYLAERGGQSVYSNVSPGAAYFLDPEHFGTVFHRSGSFGPGGVPILDERHLVVTHDLAGDEKSVERFCADFVQNKTGVLSIVWLANPDLTLH